ncbi:MAG: secretin N-terminal domain-containing protein, partial [Blastopirellula sp. JB062]
QQRMQQQMQQQMQRMQQGKKGGGGSGGGKEEKLQLIVNMRNNSIIAYGPPNRIALVSQAVRMLDVPKAGQFATSDGFENMQIYRLAQLDPATVIKVLEETGGLDPATVLYADEKNKAVVAIADQRDHQQVKKLIEKLDGSGREFKVIPLRRLKADYVAGTIRFMMGEEEQKDDSQRNRYSYFGYGYGRRNQEEEKEDDSFRVDADVISNRLLLWANEIELQEINKLLVQLGEIPPEGTPGDLVRRVDVGDAETARRLMDRVEKLWPGAGANRLQIDLPAPKAATEEKEPTPQAPTGTEDKATSLPRGKFRFAQERKSVNETVDSEEKNSPPVAAETPPIQVGLDSQGRLTMSSTDAEALNRLEDLIRELAPPPKDYHVFKLKYASATWVTYSLEDFFEQAEEDDSNDSFRRWWYGMPDEQKKADPLRLSNRRPLRFISDSDTNTIVVQGADHDQLKTIAELIELYDRQEPVTSQTARINSIYQVRYSKAEVIADAVKDVFRDLLSSNDKALQQNQQGDQQRSGSGRSRSSFFGDDSSAESPTRITFQGKLSIGIDSVSNTLLISTEGESLMTLVTDMIKRIDELAKPVSTMRVITLNGSGNPEKIREALDKLLKEQKQNNNQQPNQRGQNGQPQKQPGNNAAVETAN